VFISKNPVKQLAHWRRPWQIRKIMSEEITFLPTFTGEAVWWKGKETAESFCKAPVQRAIFRHGYKQLKLSFGTEAAWLRRPSEILLEWDEENGCYQWGEVFYKKMWGDISHPLGRASCQIKPELPNIGLLKGTWFLYNDPPSESCDQEVDEIDPDEVDIEEAVEAALEEIAMEDEEYRFGITLTPLQVNIS
jgi:hypothetical protein